jgi:hypothetical protein
MITALAFSSILHILFFIIVTDFIQAYAEILKITILIFLYLSRLKLLKKKLKLRWRL